MSLASKITLGLAALSSIGIIYYVQARQQVRFKTWEKDDIRKMHDGVIQDKERQSKKKIENIYYLQQQAELTRQLRKSTDEEAVLKILEAQKEEKK